MGDLPPRFATIILVLVVGQLSIACGSDSDTAIDAGIDARPVDATVAAEIDATASNTGTCVALFGAPTDNTGLTGDQCTSTCNCEGVTVSGEYGDSLAPDLLSRELLNPPQPVASNPYDTPELYPEQPDKFCAVLPHPSKTAAYTLETFETLGDVESAGGVVTHHGACGQCSSLQDLAVYMVNTDLTGPVRSCGLGDFVKPEEETIACIQELGFTYACAQAWYYNTLNTRSACLVPCVGALKKPYHNPDGSLNKCIQCDEENSGAVFKAVSGRTRRNSGLASALCRPCSTVAPVTHVYP